MVPLGHRDETYLGMSGDVLVGCYLGSGRFTIALRQASQGSWSRAGKHILMSVLGSDSFYWCVLIGTWGTSAFEHTTGLGPSHLGM